MYRMVTMSENIPVLQTLQTHTSDVVTCDYGGNFYLATGSGDKTVRVWEWSPGLGYVETLYSPLTGHKYGVTSVRFSPQGTMLATSSIDGCTILWDVKTGVRFHTFIQPSGGAVRVCRFKPDSTMLITAGDDGATCLWNMVHKNLIRWWQPHEGVIQALAVTPDSSLLLTSCTLGSLRLWSLSMLDLNQNCLASVDSAHDLGVMSCDFSPVQELADGENSLLHCYLLATCGNDSVVKLWRVTAGQFSKQQQTIPCNITPTLTLEGHSSAVMCVRFSPGGNYLASTGLDKTVRIWQMSGSCVAVLEGHSRYVACCAFSRDGSMLASGSNDKAVLVWGLLDSLALDSELVKPCSALSHMGNSTQCATLQEADVVQRVQGSSNEVRLLQRLDEPEGSVNTCHFSQSGMLAVGAGDKLVRLFCRMADGHFEETECSPLEGHRYTVNQVEFSPNSEHLVSCSLDGTTVMWDVQAGRRVRPSLQVSAAGVRTCRFSPDGHLLATAGDNDTASVWSSATGELLMTVDGHSDSVVTVAFTPDSQLLATASSDEAVRLWSVAPCDEHCLAVQDEAHDLGVQSCDFSPAEGTAVSERGSACRYRYLLATCGNDSLVKLWHVFTHVGEDDATTIQLLRTLSGHGGNVMCVRFSPTTGEILASAATDKTARLWDTYSGDCVHVLEGHNSMVTCVAFSPECRLLVTGGLDKSLMVWELPPHLAFRNEKGGRMRGQRKRVLDWGVEDVHSWLSEQQLPLGCPGRLSGWQLLTLPEEEIAVILGAQDEESARMLRLLLFWLKKDDAGVAEMPSDAETPHEFLCPITHEVMRDPVICSDGFTYERAAINEWFLSGKFTSPMTNANLSDTKCVPNSILKKKICHFLYGDNVP